MKISIKTKVEQSYKQVYEQFNQNLLMKLNPPFPPVKLLRYDGNQKGNKVILELNFIFFKQEWESLITEEMETSESTFFIDEGVRLPFFLKYWKHQHLIENKEEGSEIVDNIEFKTPFFLMDYLLYPALYLQFLYRKPIYRKFFRISTLKSVSS